MKWQAGVCLALLLPGMAMATSLEEATRAVMEMTLRANDGPASEPRSGEAGLTLDEVLQLALRDNLGLASKGVALQGRQASTSASYRKMLPTLTLTTNRSDILLNTVAAGSRAETFGSTATLTQPVYRGGALWDGWKAAEIQERQAQLDLQHAARSLTRDVKAAWYALLEKQELLKEAEAAMTRLHQHEKNAQAFFREGRIWRNEILQANVKVAQGEQNLITAQNQVELARAELNRLMRRPLDHPLEPKGELSWTPLNWTLEQAYEHARKNRKDLEKSHLDVQVGQLTESITGSATRPQVTLTGAYSLDSPSSSYHENDAVMTAVLSASWTAWNWGQTSQEVKAAKANTFKSQLAYDDQLQTVLLETRKAFLSAREAAKKVEVIKKSLQQSEENYRVNQIRYQEQLGSATDVLDAMDLLTNSRNNHTSALAAYLTALSTLDLAVGVEPQEGDKHASDPGKRP
ncbi:MAG: TolC family protein [Magnetococcales bacterium]|nr:TolC family protein [Magnetococcales bacterium]